MKTRLVATVALALTIGVALFAVSCAKPAVKTVSAQGLRLSLAIHPDPPTTGDNQLDVSAADSAGHPVDGAKVSLAYDMPAMGAMPEMKGTGTTAALGQGRYRITYPLPMDGEWAVTVTVAANGHAPAIERLKVATQRKGFVLEGQSSGKATTPGMAGMPGMPGNPSASGEQTTPGTGQAIEVPPARQQLIGVTYATVAPHDFTLTLRAAGRVAVDERHESDVTLLFEAYVRRLFVAETGKAVRFGQPLAVVYSPAVLSAEEELLQARHAEAAHLPGSKQLVSAALDRLRFWRIPSAQIAEVEKRGRADGMVTIVSPASGVVLEKDVVEGTHDPAGTTLYRIGNLGKIWVESELYELDAPYARVGEEARVSFPMLGSRSILARITFIAPTLDPKTRTLEARLELMNPSLALKPGMYADVEVAVPLGNRLGVPDSALLYSGEHRYAFLARGDGRFLPVEVRIGTQAGGFDEVRSGLAAGDKVALGANFLLGSDAQLSEALPRWVAP